MPFLKKRNQERHQGADDFGGTVVDYAPNKEEIAFAEKAIAACPKETIYGR